MVYRLPHEQPHRVLHDVSFNILPGEVVGLVGESGSGKSTLALALTELLPPNAAVTAGEVRFRGRDLLGLDEDELRKIRGDEIELIFQEPAMALNPVMTAGEQVSEVLRAHRDWGTRRRRQVAEQMLREVRLPNARNSYSAYPHELSGGEQQRIAIAQALTCGPALLIADEPTSALDVATEAAVLECLRRAQSRFGTAILLITHNPAVLAGWANRVLVLHEGELVEETGAAQLVQRSTCLFTQGVLAAAAMELNRRTSGETGEPRPPHVGPVLVGAALSKTYTKSGWFPGAGSQRVEALVNATLALPAGTTTALIGETGSGKSTLARCLASLEKPDSGEIWLEARKVSLMSSREARMKRRDVQLLLQDTASAFNPWMTLEETVAEPLALRGFPAAERSDRAVALIERVGLPESWLSRRPQELSGGQRQRLALARALAAEPKVLILDEALCGLDVLVQAQMVALLLEVQASLSLAYLFITHDLRMAGYIADRVAVMHAGRIVERGSAGDVLGRPKHAATRALLWALPEAAPETEALCGS